MAQQAMSQMAQSSQRSMRYLTCKNLTKIQLEMGSACILALNKLYAIHLLIGSN